MKELIFKLWEIKMIDEWLARVRPGHTCADLTEAEAAIALDGALFASDFTRCLPEQMAQRIAKYLNFALTEIVYFSDGSKLVHNNSQVNGKFWSRWEPVTKTKKKVLGF